MTVESDIAKTIYQGNGEARSFPVNFTYSATDTILLLLTDADGKETPLENNYRIEVDANGATNVVYPLSGPALAVGAKLTVYRVTPQTQIVDLIYGGAFDPNVIEQDALDRIVMMIQELQDQADRSIKVSISNNKPPSAEEFYRDWGDALDAASRAENSATAAADSAEMARNQADAAINAADRADNAAQSCADNARAASDSAATAKNEADRAAHAADSIPGFANNVHTFSGLTVDNRFHLIETRPDDGETIQAHEVDYLTVLPAEARFNLDGRNGHLTLELPFTV